MSLIDPKTLHKIARLEEAYAALRFFPVMPPVALQMAETRAHLRGVPPDTAGLEWQDVRPGHRWGDSFGTAWLRGTISLPPALESGTPLFLRADTGAPEALLFVDGIARGSFDPNHAVRLLPFGGGSRDTHALGLEAYAGHTFPGTQPFDQPLAVAGGASQDAGTEVIPNCRVLGQVEVVAERPDVSAFVFELRSLRQLAAGLPASSLRRGRIHAALQQVFARVYAKPEEAEEAEWRPALAEARRIMGPLLALQNGPTTPQIGIIGHSHIDTAWLWPLAETWRKLARTFSSVLSLMDQYPEFRFTSSAACHADVVRRLYPEIFARLQERVREGRWEINGAMWIEPDCNIPSGESFVRQCLVGQSATREMFEVTSDTLWQPDVFGYSAALPQILRGCGVEFFCTTKLSWNDTNVFPYDTFQWQGIDGSTILSHFNVIHCSPDPETLLQVWEKVQHPEVQDRRLMAFGYGDGGGGPTAEMIEMARLTRDLEGCPKAEYADVSEFMTSCRDTMTDLPRWTGELYLELHRGTLTSAAALKRGNRRCELALRDAELAGTLAVLKAGAAYPSDALLPAWKTLLLNQFHDILPGSSIAEVNEEAVQAFGGCLAEADALRDQGLAALSAPGSDAGTLLLNSLSWERTAEMTLSTLPAGTQPDADGVTAQEILDVEGVRRTVVAGLTLPPLGYRRLPLTGLRSAQSASPFMFDGETVETPWARVRFNAAGQVASFYDKAAGRELVTPGGAMNVLQMGEDVPAAWDNWDIDRDQGWKLAPAACSGEPEIVADGPLQMRVRRQYALGRGSRLTQDMVFHAGSPRVDFDTAVDWHEKHQLLATSFALDVLAETARHEIQFGHVSRTAHDNTSFDRAQFDVCAHKWTDISETGYGVAFLNNCKYGCTVKNGEYKLSLIKSGRHPDPRGDEGRHRFAYALLPHQSGFSVESVVRPAWEFNLDPAAVNAADGDAEFSLARLDSPNVVVEAVKWAEDGKGFVLRLSEAGKTGTHVNLSFGLPVESVCETNLLEEAPRPVEVSRNAVSLYLRPFEIKTLKIMPAA